MRHVTRSEQSHPFLEQRQAGSSPRSQAVPVVLPFLEIAYSTVQAVVTTERTERLSERSGMAAERSDARELMNAAIQLSALRA